MKIVQIQFNPDEKSCAMRGPRKIINTKEWRDQLIQKTLFGDN